MTAAEAIKNYANTANTYNDRIDKAIDGLIADQKTQADLIAKLQASQGDVWTPEDQAVLDQLTARSNAQTEKLEALDALTETPPIPPVA